MEQHAVSDYQCISHHPQMRRDLDTVGSVLHAVCAAGNRTWKEAYSALIRASGKLGLMPQDRETIRKMLEDQGFYQQPASFARRSVRHILDECNARFQDGETVILKVSGLAANGRYIPLVPVAENGSTHYVIQYPSDPADCTAAEAWIAWKDGQDHSSRPRRKTAKKAAEVRTEAVQENDALAVINENPNNILTGDCVVRAIAGVLEIPWADAVRKLAEAQDYAATVINESENIEALLKKEGFQEFDAIRRNGRILTGREFCDLIHDMFQAGTRIFAYIGNDHAAAILVFDDDYKIVDTWDSTGRAVTKYWAKYPARPQRRPRNTEQTGQLTELSAGTKIRHKTYGTGEITALKDGFAAVRFSDGTEKKFSAAWIMTNCKGI